MKMMKIRQKHACWLIMISIMLSIVFWSCEGYAQRVRNRPSSQGREGRRRGPAPDEIYERLQLTERQKELLEANRMQYHDQINSLNQTLTQLRQQLNMELEKRQLDRNRINTLKSRIDRLQAQLTDIRLQSIMAIRDILTPEQYEIFSEMME
jgi:Spy/CpxP family protein refolding chaperone